MGNDWANEFQNFHLKHWSERFVRDQWHLSPSSWPPFRLTSASDAKDKLFSLEDETKLTYMKGCPSARSVLQLTKSSKGRLQWWKCSNILTIVISTLISTVSGKIDDYRRNDKSYNIFFKNLLKKGFYFLKKKNSSSAKNLSCCKNWMTNSSSTFKIFKLGKDVLFSCKRIIF